MSISLISRTRRNHALEHATINILSRQIKGLSAQGNSTPQGFHLNIYGSITDEQVATAVSEAHRRLGEGERGLALHPNCGTVLLTTATFATLAALIPFSIERRRQKHDHLTLSTFVNGFPAAILSVLVALIISRPVGMTFQERYTVEADIGQLEVVQVGRIKPSFTTRLFQFLLGQARNEQVNAFRVDTAG